MDDTKRTKLESYNPSQNSINIQSDLRKSRVFCDASILLEDGGRIPIHRVVLCASSEYFHKLFMTPINSKQVDHYLIKYVHTEIMENIVDFAYSSECDINESNFVDILSTAEYFCLSPLIERCAQFIRCNLNNQNCIILMDITRKLLYHHKIQNDVRRYILRNFIEIIQTNEEMVHLAFVDLLDLICDYALNAQNEQPIWEFCLRWIGFDEKNRIQYVPKLLEGVRLGLMDEDYFENAVLNHRYIKLNPDSKPIVDAARRFVSNLEEIDWINEHDLDVSSLVPRLPYDVLFAIGGWFDGSACNVFETYDLRADRWIEFNYSDPCGPRAYHSAVVLNSKIYCIGGYSGSEYYNRCTVFDVITKTWSEVAPMHYRRCYVSSCVSNGKIYAVGGHDGHNRLRTMEVYCPEKNQWTIKANMAIRRSDADICETNGKIYILGGFDGSLCLRTCEVYDIEKNEWSFIPDMLNTRSGLKCVAHNGMVYVIGGYNGLARLSECELYNPSLNYWTAIRDMNSPRSNFGIEVIEDFIYVAGGFDGLSTINGVECYRIKENSWRSVARMSHHRSAHAVAKVSNIINVEDFVYESRLPPEGQESTSRSLDHSH